MKQFCETSSIFEVGNIKNVVILRIFLYLLSWQHQKRSNSARLPSKIKSWGQSWRPRANAFCDFSTPSVSSAAPATKKRCQVIRSAAPVTQNHLGKPDALMLPSATPATKAAPGPPNVSDGHVSCTAPASRDASLQILLKCPTPAHVFELLQSLHVFEHFWECAQSRAPATQDDILTSKHECSVPVCFLHFWLRNVHRATTACTFCTFQLPSAPNLVCFVHDVDLEICFAPQRRALFQHLDFQKCTEAGVFCPLWLGNMLRATTACAFSTSQLPKVLRTWCLTHFDFEMCFVPQRRAILDLSSDQTAPHPPL